MVFLGLALSLALSLALNPIPLIVNRISCYVGEVSYSAYLIHFAVIDGCVATLKAFPALLRSPRCTLGCPISDVSCYYGGAFNLNLSFC